MTLNRIIKFINDTYKVNIKNSNIRGKNTYLQYFYYALSREYTNTTYAEIGDKVKKDRGTVASGIRTHNDRLDVEKAYSAEFFNVKAAFNEEVKDEHIIQTAEANKIYAQLIKHYSDETTEEIIAQLNKIIKNK
jgi:hypothetical protein